MKIKDIVSTCCGIIGASLAIVFIIGAPLAFIIPGIVCLVNDDLPRDCDLTDTDAIIFVILGCLILCIYVGIFLFCRCGEAICGSVNKIMNYELGKKSSDESLTIGKSKTELHSYNTKVTA